MDKDDYLGKIIVANPCNPLDSLKNSVIMVVSHSDRMSLGLQLNRVLIDFTLRDVGDQMGLFIDNDQSVYYGGNMTPNKIHMLHSIDWSGLTTIKLTKDIGLTNDVSILAAISRGQGPEYFKACAGFWGWEAGQLAEQISGGKDTSRRRHRWESIPAAMDLVFDDRPLMDQWQEVIMAAARQQINEWF